MSREGCFMGASSSAGWGIRENSAVWTSWVMEVFLVSCIGVLLRNGLNEIESQYQMNGVSNFFSMQSNQRAMTDATPQMQR
jgi:hypothetical protein